MAVNKYDVYLAVSLVSGIEQFSNNGYWHVMLRGFCSVQLFFKKASSQFHKPLQKIMMKLHDAKFWELCQTFLINF